MDLSPIALGGKKIKRDPAETASPPEAPPKAAAREGASPAGPAELTPYQGGLRTSRMCRLTGLCSRTNVNIVDTNIRCPTCLLDMPSTSASGTFFPAVKIERTVKLHDMHTSALASASAYSSSYDTSSPSASCLASGSTSAWGASAPTASPLRMCLSPRLGPSLGVGLGTAAALAAGVPSLGPSLEHRRFLASSSSSTSSGSLSATVLADPHQSTVAQPSTALDPHRTAQPLAHQNQHHSQHRTPAEVFMAWARKAQGRLKGMSRKIVMRTINRRIVRQMARRATIGIPCIGFFFVSRLMMRDLARVRSELAAGRTGIAGLFSLALCCDALDLTSQALIITGLAHSNFGLGVPLAAEILALADKGTLAMASISFSAGVTGEFLTVLREEREAEEAAQAEVGEGGRAPGGEGGVVGEEASSLERLPCGQHLGQDLGGAEGGLGGNVEQAHGATDASHAPGKAVGPSRL
ncbi:hypothetical protein HYH03_011971 [Edaphochlamys debaryana]|uniref:Uncharacterized protein n=1 Tax=Edaphochlamys debaryana TaxID=47281 RepID=A0A836BUK9_9CHLO|nr:hypothetical protein HYH03_011971 [Edaphochlamys debaryana]|eukprot:KAG2489520.1 hypothetical protein HYH03_011971 [Edaphochlamys debaryana]